MVSSAPGHARAARRTPASSSRRGRHSFPYSLSVNEEAITTARLDGGGASKTTVVCGFLGCDAKPFNPLLASAAARPSTCRDWRPTATRWIATFLQSLCRGVEPQAARAAKAVLERMSEMLFVEALRRYVDAPAGRPDRLARRQCAIPRSAARSALMHEQSGRTRGRSSDWRDDAALSRSALHERFVHFIGQPPMQYLAQWRMQLAAAGCARPTQR